MPSRVAQAVELVAEVAIGVYVTRELWRTLRLARKSRDRLAELAELQERHAAGDELAGLRLSKLLAEGARRRR